MDKKKIYILFADEGSEVKNKQQLNPHLWVHFIQFVLLEKWCGFLTPSIAPPTCNLRKSFLFTMPWQQMLMLLWETATVWVLLFYIKNVGTIGRAYGFFAFAFPGARNIFFFEYFNNVNDIWLCIRADICSVPCRG